MKTLILAAGRGSRLGKVTENKPKCFAILWQRRLIDWALLSLKKANLSEIALVRGYKSELFDLPFVTYIDNTIWERSNMVRSLLCAKSWVGYQEFMVIYSDIVVDSQVFSAIKNFELPSDEILIPGNLNWEKLWSERFENPLDDAETYKISPEGYLLEIGKKATSKSEVDAQYMGIVRFGEKASKSAFEYLSSLPDEEINKLDFTSFLQRLINLGFKLRNLPTTGYWLEIDNEVDLAIYNEKPMPSFFNTKEN